jgi:hypothetical protein
VKKIIRPRQKRFGVLYTNPSSSLPPSLQCSAKNLRLRDAPSLTAASTHNFAVVSSTATTFQNNGIN